MTTPGPKPTPTRLRVLRGETRPSRLNRNEPRPRPTPPKPPTWLAKEARAEWRRIVSVLPQGLLTPADRQVLAVACQAWDRWVSATKMANEFGILTRGDRGLVKAPFLQVQRDAETTMSRCWAALGLTPADRSRMEMPKDDDDDLESAILSDRYFG